MVWPLCFHSERTMARSTTYLALVLLPGCLAQIPWLLGNIIVAEKGNGGWMERVFVFKLPKFCTDISIILGSAWTSYWERAGIPPPVKCPIQLGNYTLTNYPTSEFEKNTIPSTRQGTFKVDLEFLRSTQGRLGCITFVMETKSQ